MTTLRSALSIKKVLGWLIVYSLLWIVLTESSGIAFGSFVILAATCISLYLAVPTPTLKMRYMPPFVVFFLKEMTMGGWDVARRALSPSLPITPHWVVYSLHDCPENIKLILSALIGLMPGTLASHYKNQQLHIHVLDSTQDWHTVVSDLEKHLTQLMGGTMK
ncbi:sodium:proton antiporter [Methylophaga nitratireducenticrescens]|uniref:Na+/H+ antiporter subunit E n=1 Tax=Methylophaga nitratireducenticrescens TaxID=754476 RepID=UPI000B7A8BB5|nr:Na+/H+ antiporter subunit E [Methylophaga nitratireducenticrescens]ASF49091.1 sodium:proton antiporter [Methylophaga nitratireducenticrescens]